MWIIGKKGKTKAPKPNSAFDFLEEIGEDANNIRTIFDIGAHKGKFSIEANRVFRNAQIYGFEPSRKAFDEYSLLSQHSPNIHPFNLAIAEYEGVSSINVNSFDETNSLLASSEEIVEIISLTNTNSMERVRLETIDNFCLHRNISAIDLLKIDAQGYSYQILQGAKNMLLGGKIKIIYAEIEFIELYIGEKLFSEIELFLRGFDYEFRKFFNFNFLKKNQLAWGDALFFYNAKNN